jgi:hypothetical protein
VDFESSELLRAIVQRPADARRTAQLAGNVRDWASVLELARQHRVLALLFSRISDLGPAVPPAVQEQLRAEYDRNAFHNLSNANELIGLLGLFKRDGIPAVPFKGVVLGAAVYGDLTSRPAGDLDLLIDRRHLVRAADLLLERGYQLETPISISGTPPVPEYYEYHFERPSDGMVVDLHWRLSLTQPGYSRDLGLDWVWPRRRIAMLAGAEIPDLDPEITLLLLCMHGSKHAWSRLIWISDVAQLLACHPGLDWAGVTQEAKRRGLWRTLALGVLLAHRIANVVVPQTVWRGFESDANASSLARHIQETLFDAPGSAPGGRIPYTFRLLDFRDRVRLLLSLDFLRPKDLDRAAIQLPPSFHALYYLVRPVRLLCDRSARR